MEVTDFAGYIGAFGLLFSYFQLNRGVWNSRSVIYQVINLVAGVLLVGYSLHKAAYANVLLNGIFCLIALYGLQKIRREYSRRISK